MNFNINVLYSDIEIEEAISAIIDAMEEDSIFKINYENNLSYQKIIMPCALQRSRAFTERCTQPAMSCTPSYIQIENIPLTNKAVIKVKKFGDLPYKSRCIE